MTALTGVVVAIAAVFLRVWRLGAVGFNTDEAVYAGQGAAIAGNPVLRPYFPVFRAHPLLFQTILSPLYRDHVSDVSGRFVAAAFGVGTVVLAYLLGRELYGRRVGMTTAAVVALMPYMTIVSRQVLLDGPMTFFATLALYLLARYAGTGRPVWLYATGGALGLTFLSKETGGILVGAVFLFLALSPRIHVKIRHLVGAAVLFVLICLPYPISLLSAKRSKTGQNFLVYQMFRRPNHSLFFYPQNVPAAIGIGVAVAAVAMLVVYRSHLGWRELLLVVWIGVPTVFFEAWPVKGFQYLLPISVPLAVLASRLLAGDVRLWAPEGQLRKTVRRVQPLLLALVLTSLALVTWPRVQPSSSSTFTAGSGGVPGGREAGRWIRANVPEGSTLLALGPSMANIVEFYGYRKVHGLSVSPNPQRRNPVYEAVKNPDALIRTNEIQYLVWDSYSASRSPFFARKLERFAERYHGRIVHTETVPARTPEGKRTQKPVIVVYEVRP